jgi:hypothetical protein
VPLLEVDLPEAVTSVRAVTAPSRSEPTITRPAPSTVARLARGAVVHRWSILVALAFLVSLRAVGHGHGDWDFFVDASHRLFGEPVRGLTKPGGFELYASYPDVVTGPVSLLLVRATAPFGMAGSYAIGVVVANLVAVGALALLERTAVALDRARPATTLLGGVVVLVSWSELAGYGHLDDALALLALAAVFFGISTRRWIVVGLGLGLAIAAKQWGLMFLPLVFVLPSPDRWRAAAVAIGIGLVVWAPFLIAGPRMLAQRGLEQVVANDSLFGVFHYPHLEGPSWVRGAQIFGGLALVTIAVWRGRWPAAILVALAFRVLIDPATWSYYTAAVVFGACAWDLLGTRRTIPVWAVAEFLLLAEVTLLVDDPMLRGWLRGLACLAALITLVGNRSSGPVRPVRKVRETA